MDKEKVLALLARLEQGNCTPAERAYLERALFDHIDMEEAGEPAITTLRQLDARVRRRLDDGRKPGPRIGLRGRWAVAAAVVLMVSVLGYFWLDRREELPAYASETFDVAPGGNNAVFLTADGRALNLSREQEGIVLTDGAVVYADGSTVLDKEEFSDVNLHAFHAIQTPNGGQYRLELPDGTQVWLNAATTLRFGTDFNDRPERVVEVIGEAFFDVVQNGKLFKVISRNQEISVLGTQFNINNYEDDPMVRTTLLEGSVRIFPYHSAAGVPAEGVVLSPGQQAVVGETGMEVVEVDPEQVIDWKNGDFVFHRQGLKEIMLKVARWYDVDVIFDEGLDPQHTFSGQISRSRNLSEVLHNLSSTGQVKFEFVDGKTINVHPSP